MSNYQCMMMQKANVFSVLSNTKKVVFFNTTNLVVSNNFATPPYPSSSPTNIIFTLHTHDKYIVLNRRLRTFMRFLRPVMRVVR